MCHNLIRPDFNRWPNSDIEVRPFNYHILLRDDSETSVHRVLSPFTCCDWRGMHYQPGERSGVRQDTVWLSLWHGEDSLWTRQRLLLFKRPTSKKQPQISMGIWGPGDRNPTSGFCIRIFIVWITRLESLTDSSCRPSSGSISQIRIGGVSEGGNWLQASGPEDNSLWMSVTYSLLDPKQQRDIRHFSGLKRMQAPLLQKRNPRDRKAGPPPGAAETSPGQERPLQSPSTIVEKALSSYSAHGLCHLHF